MRLRSLGLGDSDIVHEVGGNVPLSFTTWVGTLQEVWSYLSEMPVIHPELSTRQQKLNRFHGEMSGHLRPRRSPRWKLSCRECERVTSPLAAQAGSLETT